MTTSLGFHSMSEERRIKFQLAEMSNERLENICIGANWPDSICNVAKEILNGRQAPKVQEENEVSPQAE